MEFDGKFFKKRAAGGSKRTVNMIAGFCLAFCLVLCLATAPWGYRAEEEPTEPEATEPPGIAFEYFYRGFSCVRSYKSFSDGSRNALDDDLDRIMDGVGIYTQEDWYDFCMNYGFGTAAKFETPDFSEYCLVVFCCPHGSITSGISSIDIEKLFLDESGHLECKAAETDTGTEIWAENIAFGHIFVNVLKVKAEDLPDGCISVYTASPS